MDISTTPPPPAAANEDHPVESMNLILPPPPPRIKEKSISPPPAPVISDYQLQGNNIEGVAIVSLLVACISRSFPDGLFISCATVSFEKYPRNVYIGSFNSRFIPSSTTVCFNHT